MRTDGVWGVLTDDRQQYLGMVTGSSGLAGSHMKVLAVLREVQTSPKYIAELTGLGVPRVRERLRQLEQKSYAVILETLSDGTNIWALAENLRPPDLPTHPTEPYIAARRQLGSGDGEVEYSEFFNRLAAREQDLKRPKLSTSDFKKYEAPE